MREDSKKIILWLTKNQEFLNEVKEECVNMSGAVCSGAVWHGVISRSAK